MDMKKYQEQSQSSKQQQFSPGFKFPNFQSTFINRDREATGNQKEQEEGHIYIYKHHNESFVSSLA